MVLAFLASAAVGFHLWKVVSFWVEYDGEGFVYNGEKHLYKDVKTVDRSQWEKKSIVKVDGIVFDAWHHIGVKDIEKNLP